MTALISRDPFAREELHRARVYDNTYSACRWCGQKRVTPTGRSFLYQYSVETDGGRSHLISGQFCSVDCMRSYTT